MNHEFRLLILSDSARDFYRLLLCLRHRSRLLIASTFNLPLISMRGYMLILAHSRTSPVMSFWTTGFATIRI